MDPITPGEWTRFVDSDREFKHEVLGHLMDHGERLARLETVKEQADKASADAAVSKRWSMVSTAVTALVNGLMLAFNHKA